ncbi:C2C2-type Zn-finger protein [Plasmopara halstedii]|uniref:C2C2-type Zn-finger protein n=1 Tax=Plasmopara halstedii TaxID=4781 RepID=A0A0P1AVX0_PLAHL|nr:C2C2-type Zn-finger protein [Plasmopara halstedii]CEG45570.1 C2C2-type Zn-finger protein [Plasmopara halstedii]|eukprot:XP_024581939.1 C2C2-type Zn-finger protein [Plasmopara halstedii]
MSSLAATQADGYYYPAEWRPEHGSLNSYHGSHPLGKRAKHLASDGVLVVRFEMPYSVWCTHCSSHIGRGVRFNARKKQAGRYFSTVIWEFSLKCPSCSGEMIIKTDPKARDYELVSGVKQKADMKVAGDMQTEKLNEPEIAARLQQDPFFQLEHENEDKLVAKKRSQGLVDLMCLQDAEFKDDYASNSILRTQLRLKKKQHKIREKEAKRLGLGIPLLDEHPDDVLASKVVVFKNNLEKRYRTNGKLKPRFSSSKKPVTSVSADPFQHFGDSVGSHLQRLRAVKRAAKKRYTPA